MTGLYIFLMTVAFIFINLKVVTAYLRLRKGHRLMFGTRFFAGYSFGALLILEFFALRLVLQ